MLSELLFQIEAQGSHLALKLPYRALYVSVRLVVSLWACLGRVSNALAGLRRRILQGQLAAHGRHHQGLHQAHIEQSTELSMLY